MADYTDKWIALLTGNELYNHIETPNEPHLYNRDFNINVNSLLFLLETSNYIQDPSLWKGSLFKGLDMRNENYSRIIEFHKQNIDFSYSYLKNIYFSKVSFYNCNFFHCTFDNIHFYTCNFSQTKFNNIISIKNNIYFAHTLIDGVFISHSSYLMFDKVGYSSPILISNLLPERIQSFISFMIPFILYKQETKQMLSTIHIINEELSITEEIIDILDEYSMQYNIDLKKIFILHTIDLGESKNDTQTL